VNRGSSFVDEHRTMNYEQRTPPSAGKFSICFAERTHRHFDRSPDSSGRSGEIYSKTDLSRAGSRDFSICPAEGGNLYTFSRYCLHVFRQFLTTIGITFSLCLRVFVADFSYF